VKYAPDLIFVFRGPILRCSKGDLRAEVKRVVWHEVAHWLGYETEEQVKALGLWPPLTEVMEALFPQSRFTTAISVTISLLRSALDWQQIGKFREVGFPRIRRSCR
jgi:hypothetical protein